MKSHDAYPSFATVSGALSTLKALGEPAETHGLLCALFSGGAKLRQQAWVDSVLTTHIEPGDIVAKEAREALVRLFDMTQAFFDSDEFDLPLLLPDDDAPLYERIQALVEWCQGYLSGLQLIGVSLTEVKEADIREALEDLTKIATLSYEADDKQDAAAEADYMELAEYARLAVILLYNERHHLNRQQVEVPGNRTLH